MSIIVSGLKLPFEADISDAIPAALKRCGLCENDAHGKLFKRSIDARHGRLSHVLSVILEMDSETEKRVLEMNSGAPDVRAKAHAEAPRINGTKEMTERPVVAGFGPAGMFAALALARCGFRPVVLERGSDIDRRETAVSRFFGGGPLDTRSNVQFGEGGAGTYSDGKLTTRISDPFCEYVLDELIRHGAPSGIALEAKPHIGTDLLPGIVRSIREEIISLGGEVVFDTALTGLSVSDGKLRSVYTEKGEIVCKVLVLAVGHSARDTVETLLGSGIEITAKPFAAGMRIEHLQSDIDAALFGRMAGDPRLPAGEYALSYNAGGRGVYTFCMCPGGTVVPAASEAGGIVVNGMSRRARDGRNANSAVVAQVRPEDFGDSSPLAGIAFQRSIETAAFRASGSYTAPASTVGDFLVGRSGSALGRVKPTYARGISLCDLRTVLPDFLCSAVAEGITAFGRKIRGFDSPDAVLTAPETRTSSPVRITRGADMMSVSASGLIPCGEGAGYAGGIMSAAVDGLKAAQRIMDEYRPAKE